jgi:hypothetical protein
MGTEGHMTRAFSVLGDFLATALRSRSPDTPGHAGLGEGGMRNDGSHTPSGGGAFLTEVGPGECRYILGDETFPALCCAAPTRPGTSWCEPHCKLVYTGRYVRDRASQRPAETKNR